MRPKPRADDEVYQKASDRHFELFKHLTTLDTAASVVVLAVYRELPKGIVGSLGALLGFASSLLACLLGMLGFALRGEIRNPSDAQFYFVLVLFGVFAFLFGVLTAGAGIVLEG